MRKMKRLYDSVIKHHIEHNEEMLFISGPRQVGKTTTGKSAAKLTDKFIYLNWDNEDHRNLILKGPKTIIEHTNNQTLSESKPIIEFDEIHKRPNWKNFLKGFFDSYGQKVHIIVTGSARMDIYKKGGDSLMGRYLHYRMHPLSVAECLKTDLPNSEISEPSKISDKDFKTLFELGGFPKPFIKREKRFSQQWQNLRKQQLLQEDIRDVNMIHDLNRLQILMDFLKQQSANQITYHSLAKFIRASVDTVIRWIEILEAFYYCFRIRPWSKNISRSLIKEPKLFLCDWAVVDDPGAKAENFIAVHLQKAVHFWTDSGFGEYGLYYIRTREKKEVDFVITKNGKVWFLVEVKQSNHKKISPHLVEFHKKTDAAHAFQVVLDRPYVNQDCFTRHEPVIVPARTFLSQLI